MDIFLLDGLLRNEFLVDSYESFLWTERYNAWGDFKLVVKSTRENRDLFQRGRNLAIQKSYRVMTVETILDKTSDEGVAVLEITGRSLEAILDDRVAASSLTALTTKSTWDITGRPAAVMRSIFDTICVNGALNANDTIPFYQAGSYLPTGNIPEPPDTYSFSLELTSVYESLKLIGEMYTLGFRLVRNPNSHQLFFDIYTGYDRTSVQTTNAPVIFSKELDNLTDTSELSSSAVLKNVAYVFAPNGAAVVYPESTEVTAGFERRVLFVKADDITLAAGSALNAALEQRGRQELSKYRVVVAFDGEIPQEGGYVYGIHYALGDLVEQRNSDGLATNMRVTEQIFIADNTGVKAYPTLTVDQVVVPGSWKSWSSGVEWINAQGTWAEAP